MYYIYAINFRHSIYSIYSNLFYLFDNDFRKENTISNNTIALNAGQL